MGFVWSDDRNSYAGGSIATGRDLHAGQVKGDDSDKKDAALILQAWGLTHNPTP